MNQIPSLDEAREKEPIRHRLDKRPDKRIYLEPKRLRFSSFGTQNKAAAAAERSASINALETCGAADWMANTANHGASRDRYDKEYDAWVSAMLKHLEEVSLVLATHF